MESVLYLEKNPYFQFAVPLLVFAGCSCFPIILLKTRNGADIIRTSTGDNECYVKEVVTSYYNGIYEKGNVYSLLVTLRGKKVVHDNSISEEQRMVIIVKPPIYRSCLECWS